MAGNDNPDEGRTTSRDMTVAVVVPARDMAALLAPCLASIRLQLRAGDELIVVDDASEDDTAAVARRHGAQVIANATAIGPYASRNRGWRSSDADLIAFTDSRCRARPGWLEAMRAPFADHSVALAGGAVHTLRRRSTTGLVEYRRQGLHPKHYVGAPGFLPWFPTANLTARRSVLAVVDGFRAVRSGGDAELCWRIQLAGLGRLAFVEHPTMDWVPRAKLGAFLAQWVRYADGHAALYREYCSYGMPRPPSRFADRLCQAARVAASDLVRHRQRPDVAFVDGLATWVHHRALHHALRDTPVGTTIRAAPADRP